MARPIPLKFTDMTVLWYKLAKNEVYSFTSPGEATVASWLIEGRRGAVYNEDSDDSFPDGTWDSDEPVRWWTTRYPAGRYTLQAGPNGVEYLCMMPLPDLPLPAFEEPFVISGGHVVPAGKSILVLEGEVNVDGSVYGMRSRPGPWDDDITITGEGAIITQFGPAGEE